MPLMAEFLERIREHSDLKGKPLFRALLGLTNDLEQVLEQLDELSGKAYVDAGYAHPKLVDVIGESRGATKRQASAENKYFERTAIEADEISLILRKRIFHTYMGITDARKLSALFTPLLDGLFQHMHSSKSPLVIFTTNYDLAVETYCRSGSRYYAMVDGFRYDSSEDALVWARDVFDSYCYSEDGKQIILFKLHGSTMWGRVRDLIVKIPFHQFAETDGPHQNVLIYPAKTKIALEDPFFTAYDYLQRTLDNAKLVISIGYSFRDYDALTKLRSASLLNPELRVLVIDPKAEERCAMLGEKQVRTIALPTPFGEDPSYLGKVWEHVAKALSLKS
jgi:hypothetical protein